MNGILELILYVLFVIVISGIGIYVYLKDE